MSAAEQSSGDTVVERPAPAAKVCCQCGKDLNGKKRLRDSRGYWCADCHKADKIATAPKGEKCADCGRIVPPAALSDHEGRQICGVCRNAIKEAALEERRRSPVKSDSFHKEDRRRVYVMVAIFAVLLTIIILRQLHLIGK
jgi:ribosomal protein S27AE